ncbi:MAG: glycosyltransferase [Candidatus Obscuribacterales bacterium]|nr:glycosyltransferase [Candidatus Obscuribacterales bacterium]
MTANKPISITQICTFYGKGGGLERVVLDLVSGLRSDYTVDVLCSKHGCKTTEEIIDGNKIRSVGGCVSIAGRPLALNFPAELAKTSSDILHYHLPFPLAAASHLLVKPKAKAVATWHHDLVRYPWFNTLWKPYQQAFLEQLDAIMVSSPALIDSTPALSKIRDKCHVVPFGVHLSRFQTIDHKAVSAITNRYPGPIVLFVGRLVYYKGCDILIRAMQGISASLIVVGEGPLRHEFEELSRELGLQNRVFFIGNIPDDELTAYYQASDIFVLPSTLATECFGIVQMEAMAASTPVINTALATGVPWVSKHGESGLTVPPGDVSALTQALNQLVSDPALRKTFGQRAQIRVKQDFSIENFITATTDIYKGIL